LRCWLAGEDTRSDGGALDGLGMARSGLWHQPANRGKPGRCP
jgi:hypothetical protein